MFIGPGANSQILQKTSLFHDL